MKREKKPWGSRTIKVSIHFWTHDLPKDADDKTARSSGTVVLSPNKARGIEYDNMPFASAEELQKKIGEILKRNGIKIVKQPQKFVEVEL
ncbi:MAG TPA: hypothetical protein VJB16_05915 [archaeon]|nr:hypothetical protein [archaeon]